jgi:SNF2 family DNA or RNA helicase
MLGVLKEDVSPKVHRADMSVLRDDLPPKKEFVITVPLTELQSQAYSIYVKSMMANVARNKNGEVAQATLWHWLAILSLLCNHPASFMSKLTERKEAAKKGAKAGTPISSTDQEDVGIDLNASHWKVGVSESLVYDEQKLFDDEAANLESIELSNKTKILCQILDASKAAGDKTLVFSQSIPTLNFLEQMCNTQGRKYARLDGTTPMRQRQIHTKEFNAGNTEIYLISTTAGGLGLNLWGANRVVIFDFKFNPILEEQAVGRAYRIGQQKDVFVYRFVAGGTFEDSVHNKAIFKKQLASRVVDKKKPLAWAKKRLGEFLFEPKEVEQKDLSEFEGMDPEVLDKILVSCSFKHRE